MSTQRPGEDLPPTATPGGTFLPSTVLARSQGQTPTQLQSADRPGGPVLRAFGPYELLEEINRGGMGVVYKARDRRLGRVVALKMILAGPAARREEMHRFQREARAAGQLTHPNIITIYEAGIHEGQQYFAMPLAARGSVAGHIRRLGAEPRTAVALVEKVARAVHHAHEHGILHRDLKPANILLDDNDEPWVADFGVAKLLDDDEGLTSTSCGIGTPAYMAPEQADRRLGPVTPRSDVWSLGAILYELLAGRRPFRGRRETVLRLICEGEPARLCRLRRSLDPALEAVVGRCLEKAPARRYASAEELADDLARWLRGEPVSVRPAGRLARAWRRLRRHALPAAGLVLLCAALASAFSFVPRGGPAAEPLPPLVDATDPDEAQHQQQELLALGRVVTLIGPAGEPRRARPALGVSDTGLSADGAFAVTAARLALLELLADPGRDRFRLRAEVRHLEGGAARVGIYVAHESRPAAQGQEHTFLAVAFNDGVVAPAADRGRLMCSLQRYGDPWQGPRLNALATLSVRTSFEPAGPSKEGGPWRPLTVEVTPASVRVWWGKHDLGSVSRATILRAADDLGLDEPFPRGEPPAFPPRGGLGLLVYNGKAAFRNVTIVPLER